MKMYNKCMLLKFDVYSYTHYHLKNCSFYKLLLNIIKIRKCESFNYVSLRVNYVNCFLSPDLNILFYYLSTKGIATC